MTDPTYDSVESKYVQAIVQMVADSTNFWAMTGAGSAVIARGFLVEDDGGRAQLAVNGVALNFTKSYAVVRLGEMNRVDRAWLTWGREGTATVELYVRALAGDTDTEVQRRTRNYAGLIATDLESSTTSPKPNYLIAEVGAVVVCDADSGHNGYVRVPLNIRFRDIP